MATTNQQSKKITMNKPKMSLNKMLVLCLPQFLVMTFSIILSQVLVISISLRIRDLFDAAVAGDSAFLLAGAPAFIGVVLAILPLNIWLAFTKAKFMKKAGTVTRQRYLRRAFDKNINEFQKSGISRYINDITNNINTLEERYFQQIITVVTSLITFCGSLYLIVRVNWQSMFFVVILLAILLFTMLRSGNLLKKPEKQKAGYLEEYTRFAKESLSAFRIVKSFQLEKRIIRDFDQRSQNVQDKGYDIEKRATYLQAANQLITTAAALFGLLTGIRAAASGSISIGVLFVLILAISNLIDPIFVMSEALPHIRSVGPIFEKMEDHLENQQVQEIEKPYPGLKDQISFVGISFNYPDIPVLKNSYVQFKKGGKYLIIGPSGSGKSTILKLLRKYFEPDQGQILIDASPLNEIEADSYYQKLANIEQDIFIFDDTIRNNITMYQDVSEERLEAAISAAGLNNLLSSRDNGLDELLVNNGSGLSGGEKARIAIARGLLSEAEIMLLDEPFASLDDQTAQKIEHNLINLPEVTVLNVSHVIFDQTRDLYDDIFLVKDGQIFSKSDKIT